MDSLYKQIPKKLLPTEYGGDAGTIQSIIDEWEKKILSYRDYYKEDEKYGTDESMRVKSTKNILDMEGSFRKLNVD